jgi:polyisoprenoid-binding protein YceI
VTTVSLRHFTLDSERSCVWVDARSNLHPIHSETRGLQGWVETAVLEDGTLDLDLGVAGVLEVAADRLSSGNKLYDLELRRRIDAPTYPTIAGAITNVGRGTRPQEYLVTGDLTFHGRTRSFTHEMTIGLSDDRHITLQGDYVFDIRQFNLKPPSMLMLKVYPEIAVRIELYGSVDA